MMTGTLLYILSAIALLIYAFILAFLTIAWFMKRGRHTELDTAYTGSISIIISARNEASDITACLESIARQDLPGTGFDLILVDDHSTDNTAGMAQSFLSRLPLRILELPPGSSGKKAAIAFGISHSRSDIIITLDADVILGPGYLLTMRGLFSRQGTMMVLGPVRMRTARGWFSWFPPLEFLSLQAAGAAAALSGHPVMSNGSNLAYLREAYLECQGRIGGEGLASGDDMFLMMAFKERYGNDSLVYAMNPETIVETNAEAGIRGFFRQRMRWVAKAGSYRDAEVIFLAFTVYFMNVMILASMVITVFKSEYVMLSAFLIWIKMILDFPLMFGFASFSRQQRLMAAYLPAQLLYPIYTVLLLPLSLLLPQRWKGRTISGS